MSEQAWPKFLILGGTGYTGRLLARHLLEQSDVQVTIAARHLDKAQRLADELNAAHPGQRAAASYADAADASSLRAACAGHTLLIVAAPTTAYTENVIHAALDCDTDYLDVQLGAQKLAMLRSSAGNIEQAGRCFITEAGFHPGLPALLVRYAAGRLDSIEGAVTAGYLNLGKNMPYTEAVDELVDLFKDYQAQVYKNGQWTRSSTYDMRKIDFGGDIGRKQCYSMFFEELRSLPEIFPSMKEVGFYISESHWMTDYVVMPITWAWLKIRPNAVRPIGKFLWWGMTSFQNPPYRVELQVQAGGCKDGRPVEIRAGVSHPDGYELTAIPVVAGLLQYLDGSARKPGLWMMGHLFDPDRLMADMQKMGVHIWTSLTPE